VTDASRNAPLVQPIEQSPDQNAIGGASSSTMPKKSFSPFGGGKPKATVSDSLYSPPASPSIPESTKTVEGNIPSFGESNPKAAVIDSSDSASSYQYESILTSPEASSFTPNSSTPAPKNYSPFSGRKPFVSTDDSLYRPPTSEDVSYSGGSNIPKTEPTIASTKAAANDPETYILSPQNFSPFGGAKPVASYNDSLYSPPTDELFDLNPNEENNLPLAASNLDDTSSAAVPETTAFQASSVKKSFSPFGLKPKAPNGNGGGYLDDL